MSQPRRLSDSVAERYPDAFSTEAYLLQVGDLLAPGEVVNVTILERGEREVPPETPAGVPVDPGRPAVWVTFMSGRRIPYEFRGRVKVMRRGPRPAQPEGTVPKG